MNSMPFEGNDEELVALVKQGDKEKFGILMERYEAKLFRYARRFLSNQDHIEDVVQEAFVRAYENVQSFDTDQKFSPWIYRIAHNVFVNALKKKSRSPLIFFDFDTLISHPIYEDPSMLERELKEVRAMLDKGLDSLNPNQKEIIILHFLEDLSYKEIAEVLHVPIGTVGVRLKRAKDALRKEYEKLDTHNEQ
jgi:RNA polymerase sigma-70 factor (ECF subfamily)